MGNLRSVFLFYVDVVSDQKEPLNTAAASMLLLLLLLGDTPPIKVLSDIGKLFNTKSAPAMVGLLLSR